MPRTKRDPHRFLPYRKKGIEYQDPYDEKTSYLVNGASVQRSAQNCWSDLKSMMVNASNGLDVEAVTGWFKASGAPPAVANSMNILLLNGIAQGANPGQRIGNQIKMERLIFAGAGAGTESWLVYDAGTQGALPSVTNANNLIFSNDNASGAAVAAADGNTQNLLYRDRFKILAMWNGGEFDASDSQSVPLFDLPTIYTDAGATVASIKTGGLYYVLANIGTGSNASWLLTFKDN